LNEDQSFAIREIEDKEEFDVDRATWFNRVNRARMIISG
jgi:hypothetical protein